MSEENIIYLDKQFIQIPDFNCEEGWILDFGGGGEGVIGQVKGSRVISIDRRKSELEEALERNCKALLVEMDGTDLKFLDNTFHTVTAFFSLMYVLKSKEVEQIFKEIYRVLKPNGKFLVWDVNLENSEDTIKEIRVFYLEITLPSGKKIETGYGTKKNSQNLSDFVDLGKKVGFKVVNSRNSDILFYLELQKP